MRKRILSLPSSLMLNDDLEEDSTGLVLMYTDLIPKRLHDKTWAYHMGIQPTGRRGAHTDPDYVHPLNKKGTLFSGSIMCADCMIII